MSITLHFTGEDRERVKHDWVACWASELDRPLVMITNLEPPEGVILPEVYIFTGTLPLDVPADEVIDRIQAYLEVTRFYSDAEALPLLEEAHCLVPLNDACISLGQAVVASVLAQARCQGE